MWRGTVSDDETSAVAGVMPADAAAEVVAGHVVATQTSEAGPVLEVGLTVLALSLLCCSASTNAAAWRHIALMPAYIGSLFIREKPQHQGLQ